VKDGAKVVLVGLSDADLEHALHGLEKLAHAADAEAVNTRLYGLRGDAATHKGRDA